MTALPAHPEPGAELEVPWTMGERIRKIRTSLGLEQTDFGKLFSVTGVAISKWEKDERKPKQLIDTLERMAAIAQANGLEWAKAEWLIGLGTPPGTRTQNLQIKSPPPLTLFDITERDEGEAVVLPLRTVIPMVHSGGVMKQGERAA